MAIKIILILCLAISLTSASRLLNELFRDDRVVEWVTKPWEDCINGEQWRPVQCFHGENQVALSYCKDRLSEPQPASERFCNNQGPEPQEPEETVVHWEHGEWGECVDDKVWRYVRCYHKTNQIALKYCNDAIPEERPVQEKACEQPAPAPPSPENTFWLHGDWQECVDGKKWRPVKCYDVHNDETYQVDESYCEPAEKPANEISCCVSPGWQDSLDCDGCAMIRRFSIEYL